MIYADGSFCQKTNRAGVGVYHSHRKIHISAPVKASDALSAEIIAVIRAVIIAKPLEKIYTDCLVIVNAFKRKYLLVRHEFLCECLYYLLQLKKVSLYWIKREKNKIADMLARQARKM